MKFCIKSLLLLFGLSVLMTSGCRSARSHPDMTQLNELLRVIADPTTDYTAWDDAFIRVRMMKVGEEPEFWVKIINAPESYSSARRRRSLIEFFRRHIRPGDTLKRFQ